MTIEERRRVLFEAWWQAHKGGGEAPIRYRGQYVSDSAIWAWIGVNAALDAVVIELPESWVPIDAQERGWEMMGKFRAAIEAAGLKVK